jgi:hypothetical protein
MIRSDRDACTTEYVAAKGAETDEVLAALVRS